MLVKFSSFYLLVLFYVVHSTIWSIPFFFHPRAVPHHPSTLYDRRIQDATSANSREGTQSEAVLQVPYLSYLGEERNLNFITLDHLSIWSCLSSSLPSRAQNTNTLQLKPPISHFTFQTAIKATKKITSKPLSASCGVNFHQLLRAPL